MALSSENNYVNLFDQGNFDIRPLLAGEYNVFRFEYRLNFVPDAGLPDVIPLGPAVMRGQLVNSAGYIRLEGEISFPYKTLCARCAIELEQMLEFKIEKDVAVEGQLQNADNDDYLIVSEGQLDLAELAEEELYLSFPTRVLCTEECRGLCVKCGKNLNEGPCSCPEREVDPRLAVLAKWSEENINNKE